MAAVPFSPEQITTEWLSESLGEEVKTFDLEQIGIGVGLLGRLFRVTYLGTNGSSGSLVAKFPTLDEGARMHVVEPMNFYEKEVRAYKEAMDIPPIGVPFILAAHFDPQSRDFVLLMEDLGSARMEDQNVGCSAEDARTAVDAMVNLHAYWWRRPQLDALPWLPAIQDPPYPQVIAGMFKQAWPKAREMLADRLGSTYIEYGDKWPELVQWFCDEGSREPRTLCHGDYRLDNMFFGASNRPVTVVDWQLCFKGRGGYDLAYFISQSLETECRRENEEALVDLYRKGIAEHELGYPAGELERDYRRTVAFCFCYPIISAGQIEVTNERHVQLLEEMTDRSIRAIEDNDALAVLP